LQECAEWKSVLNHRLGQNPILILSRVKINLISGVYPQEKAGRLEAVRGVR
jgi:hypothetical protein